MGAGEASVYVQRSKPPDLEVVVGGFTIKGGNYLVLLPFCLLPSGFCVIVSHGCWQLGTDGALSASTWLIKQECIIWD